MDLGLTGAAVCVQGGSKGMGRAAAEAFAAEGARVAVMARGREALDETVEALTAAGSPDAVGIQVDLTQADSITAGFAAVGERWGELNTLVCAAGPVAGHTRWDEITDETWSAAFTLGLLAPVRCARAALPLLRRAQWARIVNISAMSTRSQSPGLAAYTAMKAGLTSATKTLSIELGADGILANVVSPGAILSYDLVTSMEQRAASGEYDGDPQDPVGVMRYIVEHYGIRSDLGRAGLTSEIGTVVCFLGSQRNTYTTGANVNVDGGSAFFA